MATGVVWHPAIALHDRHAQHGAMKDNRLEMITRTALEVAGASHFQAEPADRELLELVHEPEYVDYLISSAPTREGERVCLDSETVMNFRTLPALLHSVGAVKMAVDLVANGSIQNAFCPVYAGHHATPSGGMGFCFVNNIAIAAKYAAHLGFERIAVVDFDTHSGNGTVLSLARDPRILFAETYQPGFPGQMHGQPPRNIKRMPTQLGGRASWLDAWDVLLGDIEKTMPEIILVSAGFDAHRNDPLGTVGLEDHDYHWLQKELLQIQPRMISALEGGYSVPDTARCVQQYIEIMVSHDLHQRPAVPSI